MNLQSSSAKLMVNLLRLQVVSLIGIPNNIQYAGKTVISKIMIDNEIDYYAIVEDGERIKMPYIHIVKLKNK